MRCKFLSEFSVDSEIFADTTFSFDYQKKIITRHTKVEECVKAEYLTKDQFLILKNEIIKLHSKNLWCGNLSPKNIYLLNNKPFIEEIYPATELFFRDNVKLIGENYWIDPDDIIKNKITEKTDLFCLSKIKAEFVME